MPIQPALTPTRRPGPWCVACGGLMLLAGVASGQNGDDRATERDAAAPDRAPISEPTRPDAWLDLRDGDDAEPSAVERASESSLMSRLRYRVYAGGDYNMHAGFSDQRANGSITVFRARAGLNLALPLEDQSVVTVGFRSEVSFYEWSKAQAFFGEQVEPFNRVHIFDLSAGYMRPIDEEWSWFAVAQARSAYQDGANIDKSLSFGALGGVNYQVNDDLRLGLGLAGTTRLEDSVWIIPIITFDWQIDDRWRIRNDTGLGATLGYDVDDQLRLLVKANYERREFRLNDTPALPRGVVRENAIPVALGVDWNSSDRKLEARVFAGVIAWQEYRFYNRSGNRVLTSQADLTPFLRFEIGYNF